MRIPQAVVLGLFSLIPIVLGIHGVFILVDYLISLTSPLGVYGALCFMLAWVVLSIVAWLFLDTIEEE